MTPAATPAPPGIDLTRTALGIEFGSTRIKAVLTDPSGAVLASGGHTWDNRLVDSVWTYSIDEVETGLRAAYAALAEDLRATRGVELTTVGAIGVSGMMHGYLPWTTGVAPSPPSAPGATRSPPSPRPPCPPCSGSTSPSAGPSPTCTAP